MILFLGTFLQGFTTEAKRNSNPYSFLRKGHSEDGDETTDQRREFTAATAAATAATAGGARTRVCCRQEQSLGTWSQ